MFKIIDHRTAWCDSFNGMGDSSLQGTLQGAKKSFSINHGVEMDVRDCNGKVVVTQVLPTGGELLFEDILKEYKQLGCTGILAIDVKSAWIQREIKRLFDEYEIENYFCFGLSIPEVLGYKNIGANYYLRDSEYESVDKSSALYTSAAGIWIDQFEPTNPTRVTAKLLKHYLSDGKQVAITSPDLHLWGREKDTLLKCWGVYKQALSEMTEDEKSRVSLCTNFPKQARDFFN